MHLVTFLSGADLTPVTLFSCRGVEFPDLLPAGVAGLERAIARFDASKGFKFSTYAHWWIRQAISRCVQVCSHEHHHVRTSWQSSQCCATKGNMSRILSASLHHAAGPVTGGAPASQCVRAAVQDQ